MAFADFAARHQGAQPGGGFDLAFVAAGCVNARIERRIRALHRIGRHRARHQRGVEHILGLEQCVERERRRNLRAVEQRQALFWAKLQGL